MNNKPYHDVAFQQALNMIVEEYMEDTSFPLWRGLSKFELDQIYMHQPGDIFTFHGVKSFSELPDIAQMFSDQWQYDTMTIVKIVNSVKSFRLYPVLTQILLEAPECEFTLSGEARGDKLEMVADEREHMLPHGSKFLILNKDTLEIPENFGQSHKIYDIFEVECLQYPE